MNRCELNEIAISSLVDGALENSELLPVVDHLLGCPACQAFYRDARALGARLADGELAGEPVEPAEPEAPDDLWRRIEAESARRSGRLPAWALRAAAVLLLAVGGWWAASQGGGRGIGPALDPATGGAAREVVLGGESGRMTEERFVSIATEVLEADPRYQREMLRVMREVAEESGRSEAPVEDGIRTEDAGSLGEESPRGRA